MTITLDGSYTYTVTSYRIGRWFSVKEVKFLPFVYADQLRSALRSRDGSLLRNIAVMNLT